MIAPRIANLGRWFLLLGLLGVIVACGGSTPAPTPTPVPPPEVTATPTEAPPPPSIGDNGEPVLAAITVGVNAQFKPFVYFDEAGRLAGFDIDLMNALAEAGQFEMGFVDLPFEDLLDAVANGEIDAAISAITVTDERQTLVDFSDVYFGAGQALVSYFSAGQGMAVRTENMALTGLDALTAETTVAVKEGTTGAAFVEAETPAQAVAFPEAAPAIEALVNGEVDAVVVDIPVIVNYIKEHPTAGIKLAGGPITEESYAIAVSKEKPDVLALLNETLAKLRENGVYDAIFQKWFGSP